MVDVQKFAVKNLNFELLKEELAASIVPEFGARISGFNRVGDSIYEPFVGTQPIASRSVGDTTVIETAEPGQLDFRFDVALTSAQDLALDLVLESHDSTGFSVAQTNKRADIDAIPRMVQTYQDWATLDATQKDNRTRELFRLIARVIDSTTDI
ncbi:MAG: hypothetical protein ACYSSM_01035 [Planctomycetota bacterium]|jgi:hypothetical protein